jgi:hypothetical protein
MARYRITLVNRNSWETTDLGSDMDAENTLRSTDPVVRFSGERVEGTILYENTVIVRAEHIASIEQLRD